MFSCSFDFLWSDSVEIILLGFTRAFRSKALMKTPYAFVVLAHIEMGLAESEVVDGVGIDYEDGFDGGTLRSTVLEYPASPAKAGILSVVEPDRA